MAGEPGGSAGGVLGGIRRRRLLTLALLLALLGLACLASVAVGAKAIPPTDVWAALVAPTGGENDIVVRSLRIPRTVLGVMVGAALGLAGALMQGHTRNPLAEPGILGVNAGAAFAVVLAIYLLGITSLLGFVWFAFAGALLASVAVFALGSLGRAGATPVTLALAGIAVTVFLFALVQAVILLSQETLDVYRFWVVGALAGRDPAVILDVAPFLAAGLVLALANAPGLNALALGEDVARALGQSIRRVRIVGVAAITLLAGGAVAAAGPIGFLGLVVPHVARYLTGPDHRWLLPYAAVLGAILILLADVVGRVVMRPGELQVGIVLALVGAPFFIALVRRKRLMAL
ncbi:MAG: iron chelate uptake ABC transporter family permease subunit [Pseudonocardiaceae bacterium]|nr:iron chelate uptake ABC transporter family permease subunit [Pseudonocardiaceae bacterium]